MEAIAATRAMEANHEQRSVMKMNEFLQTINTTEKKREEDKRSVEKEEGGGGSVPRGGRRTIGVPMIRGRRTGDPRKRDRLKVKNLVIHSIRATTRMYSVDGRRG